MPNTVEEWQTVAYVTNPERQATWTEIFGEPKAPILSILPHLAMLPGFNEPQEVYELDLKAITPQQRERLVRVTAGKFGLAISEVEAALDDHGMPVLADDVAVSSSDQGLMLSMVD